MRHTASNGDYIGSYPSVSEDVINLFSQPQQGSQPTQGQTQPQPAQTNQGAQAPAPQPTRQTQGQQPTQTAQVQPAPQDPVQVAIDQAIQITGSVQAAQKAMDSTIAKAKKRLDDINKKIETANIDLTDPKSVETFGELRKQAEQQEEIIALYTQALQRLEQQQAPQGETTNTQPAQDTQGADNSSQGEAGGQGSPRNPASGEQGAQTEQPADSGRGTGSNGEPQPVGRGAFGDIYDQFRGKAKEAIAFLMKKKDGEALGALYHPEIGEIDLVWGKEGTSKSDGFGLAKFVKFHPEVLGNLQDILNGMHVTTRTDNRIQLESSTHQAAVRLTWDNERKTWLLTAFEKKETSEPANSRTDVVSDHNGKPDDTATRQDSDVSSDKDTQSSSKMQRLHVSEQWRKDIRRAQERIDELQKKVDKLRKEIEARIGFTEEEKKSKRKRVPRPARTRQAFAKWRPAIGAVKQENTLLADIAHELA